MKINQLSKKQKIKFFLQPKEAPKLRAFLVCYAALINVLFCLGTVGVFSFCCALSIFASEGFRLFLSPALAPALKHTKKDGDFLFFESQQDKEGQQLFLQKTTLTSAFLKTKNGSTFSVPKYFFLASSLFSSNANPIQRIPRKREPEGVFIKVEGEGPTFFVLLGLLLVACAAFSAVRRVDNAAIWSFFGLVAASSFVVSPVLKGLALHMASRRTSLFGARSWMALRSNSRTASFFASLAIFFAVFWKLGLLPF